MNPNSQHQQWSEWAFVVLPPPIGFEHSYEAVKLNVSRFMLKVFGSAARMRIRHDFRYDVLAESRQDTWIFIVQVEGAEYTDPSKRIYIKDLVTQFMKAGFGNSTSVEMEAKLLAGSPEDGRPPDQWLFMPPAIPSTAIVGEQ